MVHRFPVYALDFQAVETGKVVAASKRRVRWRFGFTNQQALAAGKTGVECRGQEHEIVLIWSVTSGKRQLYMDGQEVHFSTNRSSMFQYSWAARGNHIIKVVAHAAAPSHGGAPYELYMDGQPFSAMPKAYEIGLRGPTTHSRGPSSSGYPSDSGGRSLTVQQEQEQQRATRSTLQETKRAPPAPALAPQPTADLLNFAAPQQVPVSHLAAPSYASQPPSYAATPTSYTATPTSYASPVGRAGLPQASPGYVSSNSLQIVPVSGPSYTAQLQYSLPSAYDSPSGKFIQAQPQPTFHQPTTSSVANGNALAAGAVPATGDVFAPPSTVVNPFAPVAQPQGDYYYGCNQLDDPFTPRPPPPPTRGDINNSILNAYAAPPAQPNQQYPPSHGETTPMPGNQPAFIHGGHMPHATAIEEEPLGELEKAMKKLVNLERIDEPADQDYLLAMKMRKEEEQKKVNDGKSRGKPPAAVGLVGSHATLDHIKAVKPKTVTHTTSEGVMRVPLQLVHANAVNAGALVVHGQGPPPIQRGFGIGYGVPPPNYQQQQTC